VISDLHNPGGAALDPEDASALETLAGRRGFRILCDETFRDAGGRPPGTVAARSDRWVATGSLTKAYGLGGLRIGWIAGDAAALEACENAHEAFSADPSLLSVALARALVPHLDRLRERTHGILAANHTVFERVAAGSGRLAGPAVGGTTTWREFVGEDEGDRFAAFAGERFGLALARGSFFGRARGVRITLGGEPGRFRAAIEALEAAAAEFPWSAVALAARHA
jgi:aspartate/methionine/tyrosine aminotransferase